MKELKTYTFDDMLDGIADTDVEYYLKSEADKEIEFWKKESHEHYERWFNLNKQFEGWFGKVVRCERAERESLHHKYKRCLAMAEWCNSEMKVEPFTCFRPRCTKEVWREEHKYWAKWRKIWFELAMKFKEAK